MQKPVSMLVLCLIAFAKFVSRYRDAFYEFNRLVQITCTIPVTSVQAERSFSCLKLIKSHLRTTMIDDRSSNTAVLSMHAASTKSIHLDKIFDTLDPRDNAVFGSQVTTCIISE